MTFFHWIHHLFNPHCQECRDDIMNNKVCQSCETLKMQLAIVNAEKRQMLEALLERSQQESVTPQQERQKIEVPKLKTWAVLKQMLEAEDREKARILREKTIKDKESIEKLEKETGVANDEAIWGNAGKVIQHEGQEENA